MRKGLIGFVGLAALALMLPALASASVARMAGLNAPGDYVKGDYTGMFTYLSEVNSVGNLVWAEAGSSQEGLRDRGMGTVMPSLFGGRYGVWAFNLREQSPALGQASIDAPVNPGVPDPNNNTPGEAFDILWGHKLGSGNLGLRLNRSFTSYEAGGVTQEGNGNGARNILGYGAGYDFEMNANTTVELAALIQQRTFKTSATDKSDGSTALLIAGRAFHKCANAVVIPVVKFYSFDYGTIQGATSIKNKFSGWQAGVASNWTLGTGDLFVLGAQAAGNKHDLDNSEATWTYAPNVFMAIETHLNPWLTFRAGAQNAMFYSSKETMGATESNWKMHDFQFNMGTSVKLGSLTLDAVLDPAFLQNPFAQLAGGSNAFFSNYGDKSRTNGSLGALAFPQVSATYTW